MSISCRDSPCRTSAAQNANTQIRFRRCISDSFLELDRKRTLRRPRDVREKLLAHRRLVVQISDEIERDGGVLEKPSADDEGRRRDDDERRLELEAGGLRVRDVGAVAEARRTNEREHREHEPSAQTILCLATQNFVLHIAIHFFFSPSSASDSNAGVGLSGGGEESRPIEAQAPLRDGPVCRSEVRIYDSCTF